MSGSPSAHRGVPARSAPGLEPQMSQQNARLLGVAQGQAWGALELDADGSDKPERYGEPIDMMRVAEIEKAEHVAACSDARGGLPGLCAATP